VTKKDILITGGAGFIGASLANHLETLHPNQVTCIDNLSCGDWSRLNSDTNKSEIDLGEISSGQLVRQLKGTKTLYHLAAVKLHNSNNSFEDIVTNNIVASQKLFNAAGEAGVKKIVFTSSLYAYGLPKSQPMHEGIMLQPHTFYGASKVMGETLLEIAAAKYSFEYSVARLFFIYGPRQYSQGGYKSVIVSNFEKLNSEGIAVINGDGKQVLDYLYLSDCVDALHKLSLYKGNLKVNISSGTGTSIYDLSQNMIGISGGGTLVYSEADWTANTTRIGANLRLMETTGWTQKIDLGLGLQKTWKSLVL
jgi:UDP-glucose 4-epimerase